MPQASPQRRGEMGIKLEERPFIPTLIPLTPGPQGLAQTLIQLRLAHGQHILDGWEGCGGWLIAQRRVIDDDFAPGQAAAAKQPEANDPGKAGEGETIKFHGEPL